MNEREVVSSWLKAERDPKTAVWLTRSPNPPLPAIPDEVD